MLFPLIFVLSDVHFSNVVIFVVVNSFETRQSYTITPILFKIDHLSS